MYGFRRLRALLRILMVTPATRPQIIRGWLLVILGYAAVALFALSLAVHSPHDGPVTWHDVIMYDPVARAYLLGAYAAFISGCSLVFWIFSFARGVEARTLPPSSLGLALRRAIRNHEPRVAPAAAAPATPQANISAETQFTVATSRLLTHSLWLAVVTLAGGIFAFLAAAFFASTGFSTAGPPPDPTNALPDAITASYSDFRAAGVYAALAVIAVVFFWRFWIEWSADVSGAEVEVSSEGLVIRDHTTLWRERFIRWGDIVSLARFTYTDDYERLYTVYLLDAGAQILIWESPPDRSYRAPTRRARIAERQASAARLLALIVSATGQPLLDITSIASEMAKIEPKFYADGDAPDPKDAELLEFVEGMLSEQDLLTLSIPLTTNEKWRRLLMAGLVMAAMWVSASVFAG